ncbi:MAG: ATP-dependent protease LonB [Epulopiscium sp. Nuni2H_MBin003]|nr:MAG: ATP-dependent protease LonB [Epulopiscium sp. Nuni2H_MBin003]
MLTMDYILIAIQLFFTSIIGIYFLTQLTNNRAAKTNLHINSDEKYQQLQRLRSVKLTQPLTEKMRPTDECDIVGQKDGILALKAALCSPNPQHIIIYGAPGVGKTASARIALDMAKRQDNSSFTEDAKFVEIDATTLRFDERSVADPLIGSVHDPIYQGAGAYGNAGIPQPKAGAVTKAHGGVLFIDEIGELHPIQMNKLLKVLEDRKVNFDSVYYQENDKNIPHHIHDIFKNGLPADFRLIGATTRSKSEISPALRSRCVEISFKDLNIQELKEIVNRTVRRNCVRVDKDVVDKIAENAHNGREAITILQTAMNKAHLESTNIISHDNVDWVLKSGGYNIIRPKFVDNEIYIGKINGLAVSGHGTGNMLQIQCVAKRVAKGEGRVKITGLIEEEHLKGATGTHKRKSMAKSSVDNVITLIKTMYNIAIDDYYIHINFPSGTPVDGPSAGVAMFCVLYSALFNKPINSNIAITGEITIHGEVYPVGGVTEKIQAAIYAKAKTVFIPKENMQKAYESYNIDVIPVSTIDEVIDYLFNMSIIEKTTQILHA